MRFTVVLLVCTLAIAHVFSLPLPPKGERDAALPPTHVRPKSLERLNETKKMKIEGKPVRKSKDSVKFPDYNKKQKQTMNKNQSLLERKKEKEKKIKVSVEETEQPKGDKEKQNAQTQHANIRHMPYHPKLKEVAMAKISYKGRETTSNHPALVIGVPKNPGANVEQQYKVLPISHNLPDNEHPHKITNGDIGNKFKFVDPTSQISMTPKSVTAEDLKERKGKRNKKYTKSATDDEMKRILEQLDKCKHNKCKCPKPETGGNGKILYYFY